MERKKRGRKKDWNVKLIFIFYLGYYAKKICKHLLDNAIRVSGEEKKLMAHIASNNNGNTNLTTTTPIMDRLTHSVIKETSKSL